jgi:RHS repeat-associated protein
MQWTDVATNPDVTWSYRYDDLHRLIEASYAPGEVEAGVPVTASTTAMTHTTTYDSMNRTLTNTGVGTYRYPWGKEPYAVGDTTDGDRRVKYKYDKDGNMREYGRYKISHDVMGRPTSVKQGRDKKETSYDHEGNVGKVVEVRGGTRTETYYLGADVEIRGGQVLYNIGLGGQLMGQLNPATGQASWYVRDHLGGVRVVVNQLGDEQSRMEYGPWGTRHYFSGSEPNYDYVGKERDDFGFCQMGVRLYDPRLGKFCSKDPKYLMGPSKQAPDADQLNTYSYALNNPLRFNDPTGLAADDYRESFRDYPVTAGPGPTPDQLPGVGGMFLRFSLGAVETLLTMALFSALPVTSAAAPGDLIVVSGNSARGATAAMGAGAASSRLRSPKSAPRTGTVWEDIRPTQPTYPGTPIPRSFEMQVGDHRVWVHGNATEHMAEFVARGGAHHGVATNSQVLLDSFRGALGKAIKGGIQYNEMIGADGWEFIISPPRQAGMLPTVKHALFK